MDSISAVTLERAESMDGMCTATVLIERSGSGRVAWLRSRDGGMRKYWSGMPACHLAKGLACLCQVACHWPTLTLERKALNQSGKGYEYFSHIYAYPR